jgi:rhamnosyltransferase
LTAAKGEGVTVNAVCGVVVTFNPKEDVPRNLELLRPQVENMVVVDNGSRPETLIAIREAANRLDFRLLENPENLGIATALNQGVAHAQTVGADFVALFDQDSTPGIDLVPALLRTFATGPPLEKIAIVSAKHMHTDTLKWMSPPFDADGGPFVAITSGSLIPLAVFERCGLFEGDFIIDRVDEEFCLRVRSQGYTIRHCEEGILWVTLGDPETFRFFGRTFRATHYSPGRRYYITRNSFVIIKRYWYRYPKWCYWAISCFAHDLFMVVVAEERRWTKLANMAKAVVDALFGRMGLIVPL